MLQLSFGGYGLFWVFLNTMNTVSTFKCLFMLWLIVSTLGYGAVWAFDGHIDVANGHQGVLGDVGHSPDDEGDHPACDHCCHASAHAMALLPFQISTAYSGTCTGYTPYLGTRSFNTTAPPDRPPRS